MEPLAYLSMDFSIVKASPMFMEIVHASNPMGKKLSDIVTPHQASFLNNLQNQLIEEQRLHEPNYLPPMLGRLDVAIKEFGFTSEDAAKFRLNHLEYFGFVGYDGYTRTFPLRFGLAKEATLAITTTYVPDTTATEFATSAAFTAPAAPSADTATTASRAPAIFAAFTSKTTFAASSIHAAAAALTSYAASTGIYCRLSSSAALTSTGIRRSVEQCLSRYLSASPQRRGYPAATQSGGLECRYKLRRSVLFTATLLSAKLPGVSERTCPYQPACNSTLISVTTYSGSARTPACVPRGRLAQWRAIKTS
ncbi:hypothetical protein A9Z42_0006480 [Trichoderma parareesei]|uniref:Uncharacterized protein n=1 Tax=Trichoderma parareesei TaxID=858221 RepID=A0A2H2ZKB7_TRIPA|nr:hypothetical protein A9Z42_0006480 [Trichoderma parareesei]